MEQFSAEIEGPVTNEEAHEFGALNTLLLVVVLGCCILSGYLIKSHQFYYLPESAAVMLVGVAVGGLAKIFYPTKSEMDFLSFKPEMFFFLLLPPIIFEAGYTLRKKHFFSNFGTIMFFAVLGTMLSTFLVGSLTFMLGKMNLVNIDSKNPLEALIFGALISAVDPVATLSIMGSPEINCDPLLYSLVFGESVLNDAVAIVLFKTFQEFYTRDEPFTQATIPLIVGNFIGISLGSVMVGVLIGLGCSYFCKHSTIRDYPKYEIALLFLFAYGSYAFAESIELSGIMALFFCGIVLSHYNSYNLSQASQITAEYIFASLGHIAEYFVFLYMGMGFFTGRYVEWNLMFSVATIIFCLFARAANIFPFSFIANMGRSRKVSRKMQIVMWFAGLRGAIAYALSTNMPGSHQELYTTTTLSVVIFTTVFCGGLTEPMLSRMDMKMQVVQDPQLPYETLIRNERSTSGDYNGEHWTSAHLRRQTSNLQRGIHAYWKQFDTRFMKPLFGGSMNDQDYFDGDFNEAEMISQNRRKMKDEPPENYRPPHSDD
mmetsp:Transcript_32830/g.42165  ORF Transcript_32830/g.42165 Transcript_32830/m.42165 type:complete len:543 (-) Transcript_32830:373-2001(-)